MGIDRMKEARVTEVKNLFIDDDALIPTKSGLAPHKFKNAPLYMHVIYDEKRNPDGSFAKDKARGVIGEAKNIETLAQPFFGKKSPKLYSK